jgi:hypothetical protein
MRKFLSSAALVFIVGFMPSATAVATSENIMLDMIAFITERTDLKYDGQPLPKIVMLEPEEICQQVMPHNPNTQCEISGFYDNVNTTIVISTETGQYMVDEYFIETVLVHELVHYLQYLNGVQHDVPCRNKLEKDAYSIQTQYVTEMGYPEEQKPDTMFSLFVSLCPQESPFGAAP